jgi:predicted DNA-binding antitoxin AbrB/MazE fold protein
VEHQITDAVYSGGVLRPLGNVSLHESELVRLTIERKDRSAEDRERALERLRAGIQAMAFHLTSPLPTRDELHDRF